ncbi:MAG: VTC domain-containing protein, partial [Ruminiclostridium sp.]|nr:VTC domain-containing protein [Ruminiclostridium sp.]
LREKINGAARREKFRIRYYNGDTSVIRLEKKTKINDLGSKQSAPLTAEQAQATVDGDIGWMAGSGYLLIRELYSKMRTWGLSPKTKVDYTREPFIYPAGNVRVTLDYDIRSGTYEEYLKGVEAIKSFCSLRAESVRGQLDGSIPSTSDGQQADSSALIDASGLTISDMGSMNGGNGGFGGFGRKTRGTSSDSGATGEQTADSSDVVSGNMSVSFDPSQISGDGSMPEGMTPTDTSAETTKASEQPGEASSSGDTTKPAQSDSSGTQTGGRPQMNVFPSMSGGGGEDTNEYALLGVSVLCLVVGIVAAAVYKRR